MCLLQDRRELLAEVEVLGEDLFDVRLLWSSMLRICSRMYGRVSSWAGAPRSLATWDLMLPEVAVAEATLFHPRPSPRR
jgi:hypothetical protein